MTRSAGMRWLTALTALTLLGACGDNGGGAPAEASKEPVFPMTVKNCGQDITIDRKPEKILTIGHEGLEEVVAAGGASRIVARAGETPPEPYLSQVHAREITGGDPSGEEIIGTGVDMVVSYGLFETDPKTLKEAGITSLVVSGLCGQHGGGVGKGASFQGVFDDIEVFGRIFGTEKAAGKSIADLRGRLDKIKGEFTDRHVTAAAGGFYKNALSLAGGQSMVNAILGHLGVTNVFGSVQTDFDAGSVEELVDRNPDVFVVYYYEPDETPDSVFQTFIALPAVSNMKAVVDHKVITYRYKYSQASPSAVAGAEAIAEALRGQ